MNKESILIMDYEVNDLDSDSSVSLPEAQDYEQLWEKMASEVTNQILGERAVRQKSSRKANWTWKYG